MRAIDIVKPAPHTVGEAIDWHNNQRLTELHTLPHWRRTKINVQYSDFWDEQLADIGIVVNGQHYRIGSTPYPAKGYGFGGSEFVVKMLDTGEIIKTCDMWHQGTIPEFYQIKDNAEFVNER